MAFEGEAINPLLSREFMVSGDNFSDGVLKTRPALADITNRPGKRPFSLSSGDSPHKSGDGYHKFPGDDGDSQFEKQVCLGIENLVKEKCKSKFGVNCDDRVLSLRKVKQASGGMNCSLQNVLSDKLSLPREVRNKFDLSDGSAQMVRGNTKNVTQVVNTSGVSVPTISKMFRENTFGGGEKAPHDERGLPCGVSHVRPSTEGLVTRACEIDDRDIGVTKLASSKYGAMEWSTISGSKDSRFPGLEKCVGLKGNGGANLIGGEDLLKACSCSFCSKAAFIWSDLHYQDIKGRLSVLKKSHKEASMLVQKFSGEKDSVIHGEGNSSESTKLEFYLMDQWKSLFVHMENILAHESSQLESNFDTLNDLRENCKNDLEMIDKGAF